MESLSLSPTYLVVSPPRRKMSLPRERRSTACTSDPKDREAAMTPPTGFAEEHNPKSYEVYVLTFIVNAFLLGFLSYHILRCQEFTAAEWHEHGKPAFNALLQKASEKSGLAQKWMEPHLQATKTAILSFAYKASVMVHWWSEIKEQDMTFCCLSPAAGRRSAPSNMIRVVHLHGHVEFFYSPTTVEDAIGIGKSPRGMAVWTAARLISSKPVPLHPEDELQPGVLYFVLPQAAASQADNSLACLASLVKRLTAIADRSWPDRVPKRVAAVTSDAEPAWSLAAWARPHSWKPTLDTIDELRSNGWSNLASSTSRGGSPASYLQTRYRSNRGRA